MHAALEIASFVRGVRRGSAAHGTPFAVALMRALQLYFGGRFSRKEIVGYALYAADVRATLPVLVSKQVSLRRLARLNPTGQQSVTEAKDEFHLRCVRDGLPVPPTFGWTRDGVAYDGTGARLGGAEAFASHLRGALLADFIVKDRAGVYGSGFRVFRRDADETFVGVEDGVRFDAPRLSDWMLHGAGGDVIVQARLFDDPGLTALCGRRGLQTARINTLLRADGQVVVLFWMLKLLAGRKLCDNFSMGTTGNLIAVGRGNGVLQEAVARHPSGSGLVRVASHPVTGIALNGFQLPWWREAVELACTAQRSFPELRALGWDVALTERGPVLIEANSRWDPPTYAPEIMPAEHWRDIFGERGGP